MYCIYVYELSKLFKCQMLQSKKYICVKIEWFFFIILYTLIYSTDLKIINNTERCLNQSLV